MFGESVDPRETVVGGQGTMNRRLRDGIIQDNLITPSSTNESKVNEISRAASNETKNALQDKNVRGERMLVLVAEST
jgi:hypothetical protein